eukprot:5171150-Pleurochrysis_carterae.AAC.1
MCACKRDVCVPAFGLLAHLCVSGWGGEGGDFAMQAWACGARVASRPARAPAASTAAGAASPCLRRPRPWARTAGLAIAPT